MSTGKKGQIKRQQEQGPRPREPGAAPAALQPRGRREQPLELGTGPSLAGDGWGRIEHNRLCAAPRSLTAAGLSSAHPQTALTVSKEGGQREAKGARGRSPFLTPQRCCEENSGSGAGPAWLGRLLQAPERRRREQHRAGDGLVSRNGSVCAGPCQRRGKLPSRTPGEGEAGGGGSGWTEHTPEFRLAEPPQRGLGCAGFPGMCRAPEVPPWQREEAERGSSTRPSRSPLSWQHPAKPFLQEHFGPKSPPVTAPVPCP